MARIREIVVVGAILGLALLFGAGSYESVVLAPNFQTGAQALDHFRQFMQATNPGTYFRVVSPLTQLLLLLSIILLWRQSGRRWLLAGALLCSILGDVITFTFHYPRNAFLFHEPLSKDPGTILRVAHEWALGNYVRIAVITVGLLLALRAGSTRARRLEGA